MQRTKRGTWKKLWNFKKKYEELEKDNIKNLEIYKLNENDYEGLKSANDEKKKIIIELKAENKKLKEQIKENGENGNDETSKKVKKKDKGTYTDFVIRNEGPGSGSLSGLNLAESEKVEKYKEKYNDYKQRYHIISDENAFLKNYIKELEGKKKKGQ